MRLIFVRHGEPDYVKDCLTAEGRLQAAATAKRLKEEHISRIFSSPMGRACETASYTADMLGLPIEKLDFMHEIRWGDPDADMTGEEGHPWTLSCKLFCEASSEPAMDAWRAHPYFEKNRCLDYYDMISFEIDKVLEELGYQRRDRRYFCVNENRENIALFSHGGSGGCALSHLLNVNFVYMFSAMTYGLCSICIVDFPADKGSFVVPRIELYNDMDHVRAAKHRKLTY